MDSHIFNFKAFDTGLIAQRSSQVTFTHAYTSCDQNVLIFLYELTSCKTYYQITVKIAGVIEVDAFNTGFVMELSIFNASLYASVVCLIPFGIGMVFW